MGHPFLFHHSNMPLSASDEYNSRLFPDPVTSHAIRRIQH